MHPHGCPDIMGAFGSWRQLQNPAAILHGVVIADLALVLNAQHIAPQAANHRHKGAALLLWLNRKALIVLGEINFPDELVGAGNIADPGKPQFLDQPVLQRAEGAL